METKNLKFCMMTAYGKHAHSQTPVRLMVDLGIKWEGMDRELLSSEDAILFVGCTNLPDNLPRYLEVIGDE